MAAWRFGAGPRPRFAVSKPGATGRAAAGIHALGTAGGILLIGIALRMLDLKRIRVANMLPAIVLAPLFVGWWG